ncbi:MAG: tyrosine-type recombinase/integrase [Ilumatobacteraceae bacterium]
MLELPEVVGRFLARHLAEHEPGPGGLIFTSAAGEPIKRSLWAIEFRKAATAVGIDATPHDLRHHAASLLIASGCSVVAVQTFLGHKNAHETLNTYSHLWPSDSEQRRAAIDAAWSANADTNLTQDSAN